MTYELKNGWTKDVDKNGNTVAVVKDSIQNVDIYNGLFDI